ncbi:MAG: hypothetical protein RI967_1301 [Planctomycetota bacterium]
MSTFPILLAACALAAGGVRFATADSTQDAAARPPAPPAAQQPDPFASIAAGETVVRAANGGTEEGTTEGAAKATYRYRLVEPPAEAVADGAKVPLVVFLHGAGERGDDNRAQLVHFAGGTAKEEFQRKAPCFVLAMQCPKGETWAALDLRAYRERGEFPTQSGEPTRAMRAVMQAVDEVLATKPIDTARVYLTGLSMGGFGSFDLAARRPELFAAVVPICGGGDPKTADTVAGIPFFIVHGTDDPVVPVGLSRAMRDAIAKAAEARAAAEREKARGTADAPRPMPKRAPNPMYREFDKVGHDSWTPAYRFGEDGVLDWMFAQRRP